MAMSFESHPVHVIDQRIPDVTAGVGVVAIGSGCHLPNQGRGGRLAGGAGDADGPAGHHFHEDLRVVRKRDAPFHSFRHNRKSERHPAGEAEHIGRSSSSSG